MISYADDTQLFLSFQENGVEAVVEWMSSNCLKLSTEKKEDSFFGTKCSPDSCNWWPSNLGAPPTPTPTGRNLRIKFDSNLSFEPQIKAISSSCFATLTSLKRMPHLVPEGTRMILVHSLVTSKLDYANSLYLGSPAYLIQRLRIIQNAAARLILKIPAR